MDTQIPNRLAETVDSQSVDSQTVDSQTTGHWIQEIWDTKDSFDLWEFMWIEFIQEIQIQGTQVIQWYSVRCKGFISNEFWKIKVDSDDLGDSDSRAQEIQILRIQET